MRFLSTILMLVAIGMLRNLAFAQTATIQKPSNTSKLQKQVNFGVSNVLYLRPTVFSSNDRKTMGRGVKKRLGITNISQFLLSYYAGNNSKDQIYGLRYNYLWRTGKGVYLGTGLGFYYGTSKSTTNGGSISEEDKALAVYLPLTARFRLGSPLYLELMGGPEVHRINSRTTDYGNITEQSSTSFEVMAGANLGYRFQFGLDVSVRYNTIVGLGFGIGYGAHEHR